MTARLALRSADTEFDCTLQAKNVDGTTSEPWFSGLAEGSFIGNGFVRKHAIAAAKSGLAGVCPYSNPTAADTSGGERRAREEERRRRLLARGVTDFRADPDDLEALDQEEERREDRVADLLPKEFGDFLRRLPENKQRRREAAILRKFAEWRSAERIPFDYLEILEMDAMQLAMAAENAARRHAGEFPRNEFQEPEHRKKRCEKWWRKRLRREQVKALGYIESAVGAVGGPNEPGRPLYVSDYTLARYQGHKERTREILEGLLLIQKLDPTVQVPMLAVDARARSAKASKLRLWLDMQLMRWAKLGWRVCWITVTLPGKYVCHSTNERNRASEWDENLGPDEAMAEMQDRHHRVMALLRKRGLRPQGWWNSQPQQSGTVHRHYILALPTWEDARAVCDGFRDEFSSKEDRQGEGEDRGCDASVIGDTDPLYKTRRDKRGEDETAESVSKYAARYATRCEMKNGEQAGTEGTGAESGEAENGGEQERFEAWAWIRGARRHAWLGMDSQRSPGMMWDTHWACAARDEYEPDDARMALTLREMRKCQQHTATAAEARSGLAEAVGEAAEALEALARKASEQAAFHAWHAGIALGLWPDRDLAPEELDWLRGEMAEFGGGDPLPPFPLRKDRESVYGERRKEIIGAVGTIEQFRLSAKTTKRELAEAAAAVGLDGFEERTRGAIIKELKGNGIRFSRRPDGTLAGYDLSGEILLRHEDEWTIVNKETAAAMVEENETEAARIEALKTKTARERAAEMEQRIANAEAVVSLSPTDPSYGAGAPSHGDEEPPG